MTASPNLARLKASCAAAAVMLKTAGPAACKTSPQIYAQIIQDVAEVAEVLGQIEERRLARIERDRERGMPA